MFVELLWPLALAALASLIIMKACDGFETSSDHVGRNLPEGLKGAFINAPASSMPEFWVTMSFLFLFNDQGGFAGGIGTTAGSAVYNAMMIPAGVILFVLLKNPNIIMRVSKKVVLRDGLFLLAAELLLIVVLREKMTFWHGLGGVLFYAAYVWYSVASADFNNGDADGGDDDDEDDGPVSENFFYNLIRLDLEAIVIGNNEINDRRAWLLLVLSVTVIAAACHLLVEACVHIGHALHIHTYFVAVVIAAAASSVPDTIISVRDGLKGNYDDALSNAIGSNLFDILVALGLPVMLYTLIYGPIYMDPLILDDISELRVLLLVFTAAAIAIFYFGDRMTMANAYTLTAIYLLFVGYIAARAFEAQWAETVSQVLRSIASGLQF